MKIYNSPNLEGANREINTFDGVIEHVKIINHLDGLVAKCEGDTRVNLIVSDRINVRFSNANASDLKILDGSAGIIGSHLSSGGISIDANHCHLVRSKQPINLGSNFIIDRGGNLNRRRHFYIFA